MPRFLVDAYRQGYLCMCTDIYIHRRLLMSLRWLDDQLGSKLRWYVS